MKISYHSQMGRPATGLARALSKLGYCSRKEAMALIQAGRVRVDGIVRQDAETPVDVGFDCIEVNGQRVTPATKVYLMLNKPRGLVTTAADEKGRPTIYGCFAKADLPWVAPVGRLDQASEGLLLLTNDTRWGARVLDPGSHIEKTYHVQIDCLADESLVQTMTDGITSGEGNSLAAKRVRVIRQGRRNSWLEVVLDEGKNRQIRRLLKALDVKVLRLVRVAIGPLQLGNLAKGMYRHLTEEERKALADAVELVCSR